ncbi:hypothetical protein BBJ28_00017929 [Nothophytophthora sp. Chile5]|nr:hypothetical protein BBJ28_00017929 [Nothophytophthora sp. Chile5]
MASGTSPQTTAPRTGVEDNRDSPFRPDPHLDLGLALSVWAVSYALGFRSCGRALLDFVSDNVVVYPVAHHLALYYLASRTMEFFHPVKHVKAVQTFHIAANRELLAVAEVHQLNGSVSGQALAAGTSSTALSTAATGSLSPSPTMTGFNVALPTQSREQQQQQHALSIYKLSSKIRVRSIPLPTNSTVVSCSFSADNKFLAVLEDSPSHSVTYWKVSSAKLVASSKCPSRGVRIHISPGNAGFLSVSGPTLLKSWSWSNSDFKSANCLPQSKDQEHFVDHTWLKDHMVALSERGLLLCFRLSADAVSVELIYSFRSHQPSYVRMECVTAHGKGFVLGGSAGFFSIYEASDDAKDPFPFVRSVAVGDVAFDCIAVSPNSETIVACSKSRELLTFSMSALESEQEGDRIDYRELIPHVDVCVQRPIVVTCGSDKTVRVWNFELRRYELLHQCPEEPLAVAVHPSGFQLVVAFKERVRIYQLLQESLRQIKELAIKACRLVRYAHGGHLLACASGLTVATFRTYTFEPVHTFSGHIGAVRCLAWSDDDADLFSAAHDGAIYRWDIGTGLRSDEMQHVAKQCQYAAFAVDHSDPNLLVAAGSDAKLREITAGEETKSLDLPPGKAITSMALTKDGKLLLAGTKAGTVLVYPWPLDNRSATEYFAHSESILHVRITEDDEQLVACAEDGSVSLFKILNCGSQPQAQESALEAPSEETMPVNGDAGARPTTSATTERKKGGANYLDAVLVGREDLEERHAEIVEWQQRHDQVKADVEFALHRKENEWINRLHVLKEESEHLVVQERVRYEELEARHQRAARKHSEELAQRDVNHAKRAQEQENQFEHKLAQEVARYDALSETLEQTRQRCEALVEAQDSQSRGVLHAERKVAYSRAKEQNEIIQQLHDDLKYNHLKFEEVLHQEETDYEQMLQTLRTEFAQQLETERQNTAVKQGQVSAANTKLESLKKKMQELKASSHARDVLLATERAKLTRLEATLASYERHFETYRSSSQEKEKAITGLKADNRVLENFRSVLTHRIDGLETEQAPMYQHMRTLEMQISGMQSELADEFQAKAETQQDVSNKDAKIRTLLHEMKLLRQSTLKKDYSIGEMTREFARLAQFSSLKDLESAVKDAYKVFVMGETVHKKPPRAAPSTPSSSNSPSSATSVGKLASPGGGGFRSPAKTGNDLGSRATTAPSPSKAPPKLQQSTTGTIAVTTASSLSDEALGYDCKQSVNESVKQMEHMSHTITTLRTALDHAKTKADRVRRDAVAEGSILIDECNRLRKEHKLLLAQIRELKRALSTTERISNSNSSDGNDAVSALDISTARQFPPPLQIGISGRQLHSRPASPMAPECDLALDTPAAGAFGAGSSSPFTLAPLQSSRAVPSKQQRSQRTPGRNNGKQGTLLPFAKVERERHGGARADELATVVERQKRDIQRLQTQVQLLLSDEAGGSSAAPGVLAGPACVASPSSSFPLAQSEPPRGGAMTVARIGALRPLTPSKTQPAPLHSSFVLAAPDFSPGSDANSPTPSNEDEAVAH